MGRVVIPVFRKIETSGGGGGGTSNYNDLTNKPSINNVPLVGKLKTVDLKLTDATLTEEGVPADSKIVGDNLDNINSNLEKTVTNFNALNIGKANGQGITFSITTDNLLNVSVEE